MRMPSETQTTALPQSASAPTIIKVAIVEDQRDIREGLVAYLKTLKISPSKQMGD